MTPDERTAWRILIRFGAEPMIFGGRYALDLTSIKYDSPAEYTRYCKVLTDIRRLLHRRHKHLVICDEVNDPAEDLAS